MFPTVAEYNQAIKKGGANVFRSISDMRFTPSRRLPVPIYSYGSGSYAVVFKGVNVHGEFAIRCFISAEKENIERYRLIHNYLRTIKESWLTPVEVLENEININNKWYPVIKMEWVEGKLLNQYISNNLYDNDALTALQQELVVVSNSLEKCQIGHGDVQCGNVIVTSTNGRPLVRLIDYDGIYIPGFQNKESLEKGRAEFQHPKRCTRDYNERIDRFSFWVILCALESLKYDKSLWQEVMQGGFNTLDNVLFVGADFTEPNTSRLVQRLRSLNQASINFYLNLLLQWSSRGGRRCTKTSCI